MNYEVDDGELLVLRHRIQGIQDTVNVFISISFEAFNLVYFMVECV